MEFLEDLGKKIGETVKVVEEKSKEIVEIGKINIEIGKEEAAIKKLYTQIGEAFYRTYSQGEEIDKKIEELCDEVSAHILKIEELKEKREKIKLGNV